MSDGPGDEERPPEWQRPQWGPQQPQWQQPPQDQPPWQQQQPPAWGQQQPYYYQPGPKTPGSATAALILGICSVVLCPLCAPFAIGFGIKARRQIDAAGGALTGSGLGLAGIIMGWVAIALTALVVLAIVGIAANW